MSSTRELFLKYLAQTSPEPLMLEIEKAEGIYLFDKSGKKYIDLISGISVSNLGHRHPKVVEAVKNQVDQYMYLMVYGEIIQSPQVKLAEALTSTLPSSLNNVYLVNSGSEAVEGAMKLAKRFTGRREILSFKNAYHGSTQGALSLMGNEHLKRNFRPLLPGTKQIELNNFEDLDLITNQTAAVFIEPVQGEAGVRIPSEKYIRELVERCKTHSALLVADEIQTGFGRTGKFWAFENFNFIPDILLCAKGMGGGMPIGAFISSKEIMSSLSHHPALGHITTFGGHPVSCAASLATLNFIQENNLTSSVSKKENLFRELLIHPSIKEIRSKGLLMALQMENNEKVKETINKALSMGLLIDWFLFCSDSIRIAPPITITEEEIKNSCSILLKALN